MEPIEGVIIGTTEAMDLAETRLAAESDSLLLRSLHEAGLDPAQAAAVAPLASAAVQQALLAAVPDAVQAAATGSDRDEAGRTHYTETLAASRAAIHSALLASGVDQTAADTLADATAGLLSAYGAEITGAAVGESKDPVPPAGPLFARRYYIADHLGSIRAVINQSGTVVEARDHYPYGLMMPGRTFTAGQETREGYTGHELDAETGMYYAGARYYMPALARWTAVDPLAEKFHAWSPYNYVMGNPLLILVYVTSLLAGYILLVVGVTAYFSITGHTEWPSALELGGIIVWYMFVYSLPFIVVSLILYLLDVELLHRRRMSARGRFRQIVSVLLFIIFGLFLGYLVLPTIESAVIGLFAFVVSHIIIRNATNALGANVATSE
jgi:RHS repeat-associated protein